MNIKQLDAATEQVIERGIRVLNTWHLADTDTAHCAILLHHMAPPPGARILDAGCGIGEVARLMCEQRPDLHFTLLNISQYQLDLTPADMPKLLASYDAIPAPDQSFDVVMFNFSLCHADSWLATLREAVRVLRPGGRVFIYDMERFDGDNTAMAASIHSTAWPLDQTLATARRAGLSMDAIHRPDPVSSPLTALVSQEQFRSIFDGVAPVILTLARDEKLLDPVFGAVLRHDRIGFQFSGGRDSTAALHVLQPYWDRLTIYTLDTGDMWPETRAVTERMQEIVGREFNFIKGDVQRYWREVGRPFDVVPAGATPLGRAIYGDKGGIVSRFDCCGTNLMRPMHQRMLDDGITLIVRGTRAEDYARMPTRSGFADGSVELLYPIEDWTTEQVDAYIAEHGLPKSALYAAGAGHGSDCMHCTAWWDDGRLPYLRQHYPAIYGDVMVHMDRMGEAVIEQFKSLYEGIKP